MMSIVLWVESVQFVVVSFSAFTKCSRSEANFLLEIASFLCLVYNAGSMVIWHLNVQKFWLDQTFSSQKKPIRNNYHWNVMSPPDEMTVILIFSMPVDKFLSDSISIWKSVAGRLSLWKNFYKPNISMECRLHLYYDCYILMLFVNLMVIKMTYLCDK